MKKLINLVLVAMLLTSHFSCEKAITAEEESSSKPIEIGSEIKITFDAASIDNPSYDEDDETSRNESTTLKDYCSRIPVRSVKTRSLLTPESAGTIGFAPGARSSLS